MEPVWEKAKASIKQKVPLHIFMMWIDSLEYMAVEKDSIKLACPNFFSWKRVNDNYRELIENEINRLTGKSQKVVLEISHKNKQIKPFTAHNINKQIALPNMNIHPPSGHMLCESYTFDRFIVGSNNDFAYSAALSLASRSDNRQTSLFLLAKTGMGKSHLAQAVGHHILSQKASEKVYYITADAFSNEMVAAFKNNSINKFKEKYRKCCDVLLMDDVHYLSGKERTQIELALTLDSMFDANRKVVFSSCYTPSEIPRLTDTLRSRLSCGLISNIESPDFRTRIRILKKKMMQIGSSISEEVTHFLAGELTEDIRQLESGLIGVAARASLLGVPVDLTLAKSVVKNIVRIKKEITIESIKKLVCKHYNISMDNIVSRSRKQSYTKPRQMAIYLSRKYTDAPLQLIGKSFNRYHATALHSIAIVDRRIKEDNAIKKQVDFFCERLDAGKF